MLLRKILVVLLFFISVGSFAANRAETGWQKIEQGALLVDVRTPQEFTTRHLKGAINIPLSIVNTAFQGIDKERDIVVYCRSGNRSGQAERYLRQAGFKNVHNAGGLQEMLAVKP